MSELTVRDCMHEGVISCGPDATLEEVAETMRDRGISALVVVKDGVAIGVISKTDLVNASFIRPYMRYWRGMTARHLMSAPVVSIEPDAPLADALRLLQARGLRRLVVTEPAPDGQRPTGILSLSDVVRRLGPEPLAERAKEATP